MSAKYFQTSRGSSPSIALLIVCPLERISDFGPRFARDPVQGQTHEAEKDHAQERESLTTEHFLQAMLRADAGEPVENVIVDREKCHDDARERAAGDKPGREQAAGAQLAFPDLLALPFSDPVGQ